MLESSVDSLLSGFADDGESETLTIDLAPFLSGEGGIKDLKWAKPEVTALYMVGSDASEVQKRFLLMPAEMAIEVALMGVCHIAHSGPIPSSQTSPTLFYAGIAMSKKHGRLWMYLSRELRLFVPEAWSFITGQGDLKKILFSLSDSASSTPTATPES